MSRRPPVAGFLGYSVAGQRRGAPGNPATQQPSNLPPGIRTWRDGRVPPEALQSYELVVIGCSMGGMQALGAIFQSLPKDFPLPIAVAQHRYRTSSEALPAYFRRHSDLSVVDATDKEWLRPGHVYIAPADYHLLVDRGDGHGELSLSVDAAVAYSRPSIDVLFESAADAFGPAVIGVVLTGANNDGTRGAGRIKQRGGLVIAQDPKTAEAPAMPEAAIAAGRVDRILPLERIGPFLVELCRNGR
jgi:two-component system chemotaxis response regulator CheB